MISDFTAQTRLLGTTSLPAPRLTARTGPAAPEPLPPLPTPARDLWLRPGNLVEVSDALGAQLFAVVDGEVTFTARTAQGVRRWRGHLDAQGLVEL